MSAISVESAITLIASINAQEDKVENSILESSGCRIRPVQTISSSDTVDANKEMVRNIIYRDPVDTPSFGAVSLVEYDWRDRV